MEHLFEIQRIIFEQFETQPFYSRMIFKQITFDNMISGLVGARGVGKTTLLLRHAIDAGAKKRRSLYVSADNLFFLTHSLVELVDYLYKQTDVRLLCIDEVHKYPNWNQELKNIADTYPTFKILFSGSSMIDLIRGKYDLSRRVTLYHLHGLSFREYLEFYLELKLPQTSLTELVASHIDFASELEITSLLKHFSEYLRHGYYLFFSGFSQEREKFQAIENSTQKTIYEDIGTLHSLKTPTLAIIEKLLKFVINSAPGELNASKLARNLGKDFNNISTYLGYLEQAGLIRSLYPRSTGQAALRNPVKLYPENTNLVYASYLPLSQDNTVGKVRETFVINQLQNAELPVFYSQRGDFRVGEFIFEVGGRNKTHKQIKDEENGYVLADGILSGTKKKIPLYLIGFLY
jgi:predicted AAA+ superfamily ATPase